MAIGFWALKYTKFFDVFCVLSRKSFHKKCILLTFITLQFHIHIEYKNEIIPSKLNFPAFYSSYDKIKRIR